MPLTQGFDPHAAERATRGRRRRGARFRLLLVLAAVLLGGAVAFERWLWGWTWGGSAAARGEAAVLEPRAEPPSFALPPAAPSSATQAAAFAPPPRPAPAAAPRRAEPAREPRLPSRVA